MKIYDISQEVFQCQVYPGDPAPERKALCSMEKGDLYNLTAFQMCAHNGTHIDAPFHFIKDGKTVDAITLKRLLAWRMRRSIRGSSPARMPQESWKKPRRTARRRQSES